MLLKALQVLIMLFACLCACIVFFASFIFASANNRISFIAFCGNFIVNLFFEMDTRMPNGHAAIESQQRHS